MTAVPLTVPFHHLITASLQNPISAMCNKVASLLLHLLEKDYCLLQHIRNIQSIFLMGAGDVMTLFSSELFKSIQMKKAWYMSSFLNGVMLESLQSHHSEVDDLIQVSVGQIPSELNHTVELVSVIHLDYKIPWPLDMIITQEDLYTYNKVFHFLMQLKWARWVLQQCHLKGFQVPSSLYSTSHCLHMLKRKLLQFVSSVDAYVLSVSTYVHISVVVVDHW
jgi:gamma-tubulin complex component 5